MRSFEARLANSPQSETDLGPLAESLQRGIAETVRMLGRRGAVVAVSGGVDSSVVAALCARALGPERVLCLRLPERGLSETSSQLALELVEQLGVSSIEEPVTPALEALGCYEEQTAAVRRVYPEYQPGWRYKLVRSSTATDVILFSLVIELPDGSQVRRRMPSSAYRSLLAATNMKQRVRKLIEYTWGDRLHYAVAGTPNLLEYDQGFFVKGGDGLADLKPIARLYKTEVFELAQYLGLPAGIASRAPTTETFSLPQSQAEFYFGHDYPTMDLLLWGESGAVPVEVLAREVRMDVAAVLAAYREIAGRRAATDYLRRPAILLDPAQAWT